MIKKQAKINLFQNKGTNAIFPPVSIEKLEEQLEAIEKELQEIIWESSDDTKKSLIYSVLCQYSRIIAEYKSKDSESKFQKELLDATLRTVEKEKERIAKCIHDEFGIALTALRMHLAYFQDQGNLSSIQKKLLSENLGRLDGMTSTIRDIVEDLAPPSLRYLGYFKSIEALSVQLSSSRMAFEIDFPADYRLDPEKEVQLYRISQEIVNNIIKHTDATRIKFCYHRRKYNESIIITYNCRGLTSEQAQEYSVRKRGSGLNNIQSRAQLINALVEYVAADEHSEVIVLLKKDVLPGRSAIV